MPRRLLLINPNTSASITQMLAEQARRVAGNRAEIHALGAAYGAPALQSGADLEIASRAVLDIIETTSGFDAIIIGAFGDPGLDAAQKHSKTRVYGMGRSGLMSAARNGRRFAIVTLGEELRPLIEQAVAAHNLTDQLVTLRFIDASIHDLANHPAAYLDMAINTARSSVETHNAEAVLFGGAPFAGMIDDIASRVNFPVVDGLKAAVMIALQKTMQSGH